MTASQKSASLVPMSISDKILEEKTICVFFIKGRNALGINTYAYIAVPLNRVEAFNKAQKAGNYNLHEYGNVLKIGIGEPSDEVKREMFEKYQVQHDNIVYFE